MHFKERNYRVEKSSTFSLSLCSFAMEKRFQLHILHFLHTNLTSCLQVYTFFLQENRFFAPHFLRNFFLIKKPVLAFSKPNSRNLPFS